MMAPPADNAAPEKQSVARLLIVDDETAQMKALCETLRRQNYETTGFSAAAKALEAIQPGRFDLLLADLMMPDMDGIRLLKTALEVDPDLVGVLMTGQGTIETAVNAMKAGALDYILKPFKLSAILPVLARALSVRQLRMENRELNRRVREHAAELEQANGELEAFSYSVSHDLRAPLRAIDGFNGLALQQYSEQIPPGARRLLLQVEKGAKEMAQLIDDLLRFSRLSRQPLHREPVNVRAMVEEIAAELRREAGEREVQVQIGELPEVLADAPLLRQVFVNLLSNAFKFSRNKESRIEISADGAPKEHIFCIRDNGAGFDMAYAKKLFKVFQRLHSTEEFEGTGIGLSIVHRIVQRHGGRVWAEGRSNEGAAFYIALPS